MVPLHMTEEEVVRNIADVLEKVRHGSEVIIEKDRQPIAVIKPSLARGRPIAEVIEDLHARGSRAAIDEAFARDIAEGIELGRESWNPPPWD